MTPRRVFLRAAEGACRIETTAEACLYAQLLAASVAASDAAAVVIGTTCDQMRRAAEAAAGRSKVPVCIMHVPATWQTGTARMLYRAELERMCHLLRRLGGAALTQASLRTAMRSFDAARQRLLSAREMLMPQEFSRAMRQFHETNAVPEFALHPPFISPPRGGVPIALVGGPLLLEHYALWDMIEAAGGRIVLDGTENGERTLPSAFDETRMHADATAELVHAYFDAIPDVFRRPNTLFHAWLRAAVKERGVRGVVWIRHTWCDLWHGELRRAKDALAVPVLDLEFSDSGARGDARATARVQAFLETLR